MALTVRLPSKTERTLNALARRRGATRSDVVREAIEHYSAAQSTDTKDLSVYDAWSDVIGIGRLVERADTRTTGERFAELIRAKARARRAR